MFCSSCGMEFAFDAAYQSHAKEHFSGKLIILPLPIAFERAFKRQARPEELILLANGKPLDEFAKS